KAACVPVEKPSNDGDFDMEKIHTPNVHTIEELVEFMGAEPYNFAKTIIYKADDKYVAAMVRGDREINEVKLKNLVGCIDDVELAEPFMVKQITNAEVGFAGPVGLDIPVYVDKEVEMMKNFIIGANETDMHYRNVNIGKDFTPAMVADIRVIEEGDACPKCGKPVKTAQGIEVGHIFKLGTKYSKALGLTFQDEDGQSKVVTMGCYGIGVTRCLSAAVEQNNDENGIIWPVAIAPFEAIVIPVNAKNEEQVNEAERIYNELKTAGIDALLDDRNERPGVKFKDADLIGIPVRIVVGKRIGEGMVEYKERTAESSTDKTVDEAMKDVIEFVRNNK
ncbi:MAG: proline--tRNA ligase, partial [Clostridia bacterium]|nr:proline--tRNA ligase [Clostridia bacterium]